MGLALMSSLLPVIAKGVVLLVDKIKGSGTGAEKKPLATEILQLIFGNLQTSTPGLGLPSDMAGVGAIVEDTVKNLNDQGKLKGHATVVDSDIDAALLNLCATFLESKARELRSMTGAS